MLIGSLLRHEAIRIRRGFGFTTPRAAMRIGLATLLLPLVGVAFALGVVWVRAAAELGVDGMALLSRYALPFIFIFTTVRVAFDCGVRLNPRPYVGLTYSRRALVAVVIVRSLLNKYSLIGCLFASGLLLAPGLLEESRQVPLSWIITLTTIWMVGDLAVHALRGWLIKRPVSYVGFTGLGLVATLLGWLADLSSASFAWLETLPAAPTLLGLAALCGAGTAAYLSLVESTYLDNAAADRGGRPGALAIRLLSSPNPATRHAALVLWLIIRVPKARTAMLGGAVMVAVAAFIYWLNPGYGDNRLIGMGVLAGFYSSGSLAFFVGQLGLSWQSSFYDLLAYTERDPRAVIRGHVLSLRLLVLVQYALAAPLFAAILDGGFFIATSFAIFNLGCVPPVCVWISLSNSRRIDPYESAFFSQEGASSAVEASLGTAVLVAIPLLVSFAALASETAGLLAITTVGVTGVALGPSIERRLASLHTSRRYVLAHRLRQRSCITHRIVVGYLAGEKSVGFMNVDSTSVTIGPSASDASRIAVHSGSSKNPCHDAAAASRLSWASM